MNLPEGFVLDQPEKKPAINLPDGFVLDSATTSQPEAQSTESSTLDLFKQFGQGASDSIANLAGLPVDAMESVLNLGVQGINKVAGTDLPSFKNSFGSSGDLKNNQSINAGINTVNEVTGSNIDPLTRNPEPKNGKETAARIGGAILPTLTTGVGAFRSIPQAATPIGRTAQVSGVGGAQGIIQSESEDPDKQLISGGIGAVTGGALQGVGGKIASSLEGGAARKILEKAAPTVRDLKDKASELYAKVDDLGVSLKPESYQGIVSKLNKAANNFGFTPEIQKNSAAALNALGARVGQTPSFSDLNNFRKILGSAAQSSERADSALASKLIQTFDDTLDSLPKLAIQGDPNKANQAVMILKKARSEFAKSKKSELLETAITNGKNAASGAENGVRGEFRSLLKRINSGKVKGFSEQEIKQIQNVVDGKGANLAKLIGKGAFDVSGNNFLGGSIGATASGALGGAPAILAQQAISGGAKKFAEKATVNNAQLASTLTRAGKDSLEIARAYIQTVPRNQRTPEALASLIQSQGGNAQKLISQAERLGGENKEIIVNAARLLITPEG